MKEKMIVALAAAMFAAVAACAAEWFVATDGNDSAAGSREHPWRTIQRAADVAMPGDIVTIRGGVYREWVKPANAGLADAPITYRAATGDSVVVTGADPVTGWTRRPDGLWEANVTCGGQGEFNPFTDFISGDWFVPKKDKRYFRTRLVQNGTPLELFGPEVLTAEKAKSPALMRGQAALVPGEGGGTIVAAFHDDPNTAVPELAVRTACFYPAAPHRDYIHLAGISFRDAAPNWAPPTAEQRGLVGTHWSQGWIIEDCEISGSPCTGLTLGKYGDEYDNLGGSAEAHAASIARAMTNGAERVGRHIVRRCRISDCGQAGICGAFGGAFSVIEDCDISYCYWQREYYGAEMGCIKLHNAVDAVIQRCRLHHCGFAGIWLDWMAQGTIVRNNIFWHNERDLYLEVNHGPILVEGNDILSGLSFKSCGQGAAFVGNRIAGAYRYWNDGRRTPICKPHSILVESPDAVAPCGTGDLVFINNMLAYNPKFLKEEFPSRFEDNWMVPPECWKVNDETGVLSVMPPPGLPPPEFKPVDAKRLGRPHFVAQDFPEPSVTRPKIDGAVRSRPCRDVRFSPLGAGTMLYGDPVHLVDGQPFAKDPTVIRLGGRYLMYYSVNDGEQWGGAIAESTNLVDWVRVGDIEVDGAPLKGGWVAPCVKKFDGKIHLFAQNPPPDVSDEAKKWNRIWHATSDDGIHFAFAPGNPILGATGEWSNGRAIDAEAYRAGDKMMMAFATRSADGEIQLQGLASSSYGSDYGADKWTETTVKKPMLKPELPWEGHCIEAASVVERKGIWYMFYAGAYNHERQQIGLAWSADGVNFTRFSDTPVLPHGAEGTWNAWESGHPGVFEDDDGRIYLFYQGKAALEGGYLLSCLQVDFKD